MDADLVLLDGGPEEAGKQQPAGGCSSCGWEEGEAEARRQQLLPAARANAFAQASS